MLMYENYFFQNILWRLCTDSRASLMAQEVKNLPAMSPGSDRRHGSDPWVMKICWRRKWQCTPVSLPGKSHGQRSLVSYSLRDHKESADRTEHMMDGWDTDSQGSFTLLLSEILLSFALALLGIFSQDFIIILVLFSFMLFVKVTILRQSLLPLHYWQAKLKHQSSLFQDKCYSLIRGNPKYLNFYYEFHFVSIQFSLKLINSMLYFSDLDDKVILYGTYKDACLV